jgi:hypothetical protein
MRRGNMGISRMVAFQPTLIEILFEIAHMDRMLSKRASFLIRHGRKGDHGFNRTMARLAEQRAHLREIQSIGRYLGDSFAWFFYQFDVDLLEKHAKRPLSPHMSIGVGGQAELRLAQGLRTIAGYFVIHHAATSFLRLGDMSVWSPKSGRIVGIGEAKAGIPAGDRVSVQVQYIFRADAEVSFNTGKTMTRLKLPAAEDARRLRQLGDIQDAIAATVQSPAGGVHHGADVDSEEKSPIVEIHTRQLADAVARSRGGAFAWEHAGPGLLLGAYRRSGMNPNEIIPPGEATRVLAQHAQHLMHPDRNLNSLVIGSLAYGAGGSPVNHLGMPPLIWQNLDSTVLFDILFKRVTVVTLFNPAYLIAGLNAEGFEVSLVKAPLTFRVTKTTKTHRTELFGIDYFLRLRTQSLYEHESVLRLLLESTRRAEHAADGRPAKIELRIGHPLIRPGRMSKLTTRSHTDSRESEHGSSNRRDS